MKKNINLNLAKKAKNDEFYTQLIDIEKEMMYYDFNGKVVYCNSDGEESNFTKYFINNFRQLGLKKLICTSLNGIKIEFDGVNITKSNLMLNGDFRNEECISIMNTADILVTNPPFSLLRNYIELMIRYDKKFIVIGNKNAFTYVNIFKSVKDNKIFSGKTMRTGGAKFLAADGTMAHIGICTYIQNITDFNIEEFNSNVNFNDMLYEKYDNYNAINVDRIKDIPMDYNGEIGVPITWVYFQKSNQYEILNVNGNGLNIKDRKVYKRIIIKKILKKDN